MKSHGNQRVKTGVLTTAQAISAACTAGEEWTPVQKFADALDHDGYGDANVSLLSTT